MDFVFRAWQRKQHCICLRHDLVTQPPPLLKSTVTEMPKHVLRDMELEKGFKRRACKLYRRLCKQRRQVLRRPEADTIHDLRITTRRFQALIDPSTVSNPTKKAVRVRKRVKQIRHALVAGATLTSCSTK